MKTIAAILAEIRPEYDFETAGDFVAEGMLDSFDIVTLVAALERNFCVSIRGTDIVPENFQTMRSIENLLKKYGVRP